ncbi:hypothetical protein OPV22_021519 [Ensete ventricosum]|uniref:Transcription repressor n=1 Tax=Ensete ventricosum TaxID=4639 RepID=A0AAV8QHB0_ENSVE|nr:hypothetical protein OPV22_021519 [Ensete ventricosum]RWW18335.1 hypothetical protein GW17_00017684 [Ensete ventricosum]RWW55177.1 hypothetical protein BHE74_00038200 [Ensete ventricosum]RZS02685.1 hypothetical protein BHM03_00032767 [Ensete ventricosum]
MGNHRFRLSDMMPSSWFYKLKDVGRSTRRQSIHNTMKRSHPHTSSPPRELAHLPRRSSYYVPTRERTEGFPRSPVNHKASDTHFPAVSPRTTRANTQRKATESEIPSYRDYIDRCQENSSTDDNTMGTMSGDLEVLSELKLPPILTKPIKDVHDDDAPDKTCVLREHRKRIGRRPEVGAYRTPRLAGLQAYRNRKSAVQQSKALLGSLVVVKSSSDPQRDFRESMVEMIIGNNIRSPKEMEELLACYLSLNSCKYHSLILKEFQQIWLEISST